MRFVLNQAGGGFAVAKLLPCLGCWQLGDSKLQMQAA
jgi:hypothetical protein